MYTSPLIVTLLESVHSILYKHSSPHHLPFHPVRCSHTFHILLSRRPSIFYSLHILFYIILIQHCFISYLVKSFSLLTCFVNQNYNFLIAVSIRPRIQVFLFILYLSFILFTVACFTAGPHFAFTTTVFIRCMLMYYRPPPGDPSSQSNQPSNHAG